MRFVTALLLLILAVLAIPASASSNPAVGTWQVTSPTESGEEYTWKLVIKEDGGKLSGTISGEPGDFTLSDVKYEDDKLSFKVTIEDQTFTIEARISGNKLEGAYKSATMSGTLKGVRQA